jgi:hypothetical protein
MIPIIFYDSSAGNLQTSPTFARLGTIQIGIDKTIF